MMRNPLFAILAGLAVFVLLMMLVSPKSTGSGDGLLPEGPAPPMRIKAPDGTIHDLSDLKGKVVLVKFWATWCGPCAMSTPYINSVYEKHKDEGFTVLGVALEQDNGEQIPAYVRDMKVQYPVGMADPPEYVRQWISGSVGIPAVFIVDKQGRIRWSRSGFDPSREHEIEDKVVELLRE